MNSELPICVRCNGTGKSAELGMILKKCGRCEGLGRLSKSIQRKFEVMNPYLMPVPEALPESLMMTEEESVAINSLFDTQNRLEKMAELQEQTVEATKKKRGRPPKPKYFGEKVVSVEEAISEMKKAALKAYTDEMPERLEKFKKDKKHLFPAEKTKETKRLFDADQNFQGVKAAFSEPVKKMAYTIESKIAERPKRGRPPSAAVINREIRKIVAKRKGRPPKIK